MKNSNALPGYYTAAEAQDAVSQVDPTVDVAAYAKAHNWSAYQVNATIFFLAEHVNSLIADLWRARLQASQPQNASSPQAQQSSCPDLDLLEVSEVAKILRCAQATVYRLAGTQELPSIRIGRMVRVRRVDLAAFVHSNLSATEDQ